MDGQTFGTLESSRRMDWIVKGINGIELCLKLKFTRVLCRWCQQWGRRNPYHCRADLVRSMAQGLKYPPTLENVSTTFFIQIGVNISRVANKNKILSAFLKDSRSVPFDIKCIFID